MMKELLVCIGALLLSFYVEDHSLAALPAESQLRSHLGFVLNTGLTPAELNNVVMILKESVGEGAGSLAERSLGQVLASRKGK